MSEDKVQAGELSALADGVRDFCRKRLPDPTKARPSTVRDVDQARINWGQMADQLGLEGLLIPEGHGGAGATLAAAGRVAEVLGAELASVPFLSSGVLAPVLLTALAKGPGGLAATQLLDQMSGRNQIVSVAWAGSDPGSASSDATFSDDKVSGTFKYVLDADVAEVLILIGPGADQIVLVNTPDVTVTPRPAFDLTQGLSEVTADNAPARPLGSGEAATAAFQEMLRAGRLVLAADSAGGAQGALQLALDYAKTRIQFGREIGSFQAIKHILADCKVDAESALSIARLAIDAVVDGESDADELAALAAFSPAERYSNVAAAGIQVHGGIGFTVETRAHLYRRRAEGNRHLLGDPAALRAEYVRLVAASGEPAPAVATDTTDTGGSAGTDTANADGKGAGA